MKIWCRARPGVYHVEPTTLSAPDRLGRRDIIPGILIEFTTLGGPGAGSLLDTVEEQRKRGWDDATREHVEEYLQGHRDWGFALYHADDDLTAVRATGAVCQVMTAVQGGVRFCGRPVEADGDLCDVHEGQRATLETAEGQGASEVALPPPPPEEARV